MSGPPRGPLRRRLGWALPAWLVLWFKEWSPIERVATPTLDESWHAVKGWELLHALRSGIDSVFTYGRLGHLHTSRYVPELWAWKVFAFELVVKGLLCALCVGMLARLPTTTTRVLAFVGLCLIPCGLDAFAYTGLLAICAWRLAEERRNGWAELVALFLGAVIALVKFTYFALYALGVVVVALALWRAGRHAGGREGRASALGWLARALASLAFLWVLLGQSLADFPAWIQSSLWISSGYADGMSAEGPRSEQLAAWAVLGLVVLVVALDLARGADRRRLAGAALVLATTAIAYKAGFTRHMGNSMILFAVAASSSFFLVARARAVTRRERWLVAGQTLARGALLVLAVGGYLHAVSQWQFGPLHYFVGQAKVHAEKARLLWELPRERARLEQGRRNIAAYFAMPHTRARVGEATLDVFGNEQAIALLNELDYHPRPVFQSYAALTPELLELNRAFYAGVDAPRFVLAAPADTDQRLPLMDDNEAFEELLARYRPCLGERGYILLERRAEERPPVRRETVLEREAWLGEWIELADLPGEALELSLDIDSTWRGRARSLVRRTAQVWCDVERAGGQRKHYRVLPRQASAGVLVRPWATNREELARLFCGERMPGVERIRVRLGSDVEGCYAARIRLKVERLEGLLGEPEPELARAIVFSAFHPPPAQAETPLPMEVLELRGRSVALVHAPAWFSWKLAPGRWRLAAGYGLLDQAWRTACSDGVVFTALVLEPGGGVRVLFRRALNPRQVEGDRWTHELSLDFDLAEESQLFLRTTPGPENDSDCDWAFWSGVEIQRL